MASAWSPSRNTTSPAGHAGSRRDPLHQRQLLGGQPAEQLLDRRDPRAATRRRSRTGPRMRFSHHSSAPSASGNAARRDVLEHAGRRLGHHQHAADVVERDPQARQHRRARRRRGCRPACSRARRRRRPSMSSTTLRNSRSVEPKNRSPCSSNTATESAWRASTSYSSGVRTRFERVSAAVVAAAHDAADLGLEPQRVEVEVGRHALADLDAARAVAPRVERRREHADPELAGQHRDHAAGDAALRREPDGVHPLARVVVHAAGAHHAEHVLDVARFERALAGDRVRARGSRASPPSSPGRGTSPAASTAGSTRRSPRRRRRAACRSCA